eukprot:PRCOL_00006718-RA
MAAAAASTRAAAAAAAGTRRAARAPRLALRGRADARAPARASATASDGAAETGLEFVGKENARARGSLSALGSVADDGVYPRDFYEMLDVDPSASDAQIKEAYRRLQKRCHPDIAGPETMEVCILMNEAYAALSEPSLRRIYDSEVEALRAHIKVGYTGEPLSKWARDDPSRGPGDQRATFVDETLCIGCQHCCHVAPETFGLEDEWGRARVHTQWGSGEEEIEEAIACCPVDCIHMVSKQNLAVLEWAMTQSTRVEVGVMLGGGPTGDDPFDVANAFIRKGDERRARMRAQGLDAASSTGDVHVAFLQDVRVAWGKLRDETKREGSLSALGSVADDGVYPRDFYEILDVDPSASDAQIKAAYRRLQKRCHPDIAGPETMEVCILMNEAYAALSDPSLRRIYDSEVEALRAHIKVGYTGEPLSKWARDDPSRGPGDQRATFVDESACIGCMQCVHVCPGTFGHEEMWGRARVHTQWGNEEDEIQEAMEVCPVDCIHMVSKNNLAVLEWAMTQSQRVDVGIMLGGGPTGDDPFDVANAFIRKGDERRARMRAQGLDDASSTGDVHVAFLQDVRMAWAKLSDETKQNWGTLVAT